MEVDVGLARAHAERPPAWVMFSDDDDLWSERRVATYASECAAAAPTTQALLCRRKTMVYGKRAVDPRDASDVRALLANDSSDSAVE